MANESPATPNKLNLLGAASAPTILDAALRLRAQDVIVLPKRKGEKDSGLKNWQNLAPTDAELRRFYATGKYDGVIVRPGARSQNLVIIDCDGERVYEAFCAQFPSLVETYTERSGSGKGYHLFYQVAKLPTDAGTKINRKGVFDTDELGFEVFFDSGGVVVAPSVYVDGVKRYRPEKALDVLRVADVDAVIAWAMTLETKQEREKKAREVSAPSAPTKRHTGVSAPRNGDIAPDLVSDIEQALGITEYKRDGWSKPIRCVLAHHENDDSKPAASWHKDKHIYSCLKCGVTDMLAHPLAEVLGFDVSSYYAKHPTWLNSQKLSGNASQVNQRYIDLPSGDVIAVQSDVGTGKTTAMIHAAKNARSSIYLAPRERLAENYSRTADRMGIPIENYKDLTKADRRRPARSAFCINSYSALADEAPGLPVPELLELDEIEQLIEHIYGDAGTFDDREAVDAAEALKYAIHGAKRLLIMDAHLSPLALDYLKAQGREAQLVVNDYVIPHGTLTIHAKREGALAQGETLVAAHEGVIVYAVASVERATIIYARLVELLGNSADVLLLTAENGGGERQSAFFADPNGQIGQYRAVVYSPVIGTGFDITAPVRAVVGIMAAHLSAYEARQMIGRCRNVKETHVYLPMTAGTLEESAEAIETLELEKAERTIKQLNAVGVRVQEDIDNAQRDYLRWHARYMARRNWSINHLTGHFLSLCKGYTITQSETEAPGLREKLDAIKQAITDARKALVLTVEPIDADTFRRLRDAGKADEKAIAGHLRGKIEGVIGVTISPQVRDQLWSDAQRHAVRKFTDLIDDALELKLADAQEQIDGVPLPKRRHRSIRRIVVNAFLRGLVDGDGHLLTLDKDEFEAVIAPIVERYSADLKRLFGWRPDRCKTAAATVRRVLDTVGLKLDSDQPTKGGKHVRIYHLNAGTLAQIRALADQRLAMLNRKRAEQFDQPVNLKTAIGGVSRGDGAFKTAEPRLGRHKPLQPLENSLKAVEPLQPARDWGGASHCNPFSRPDSGVEVEDYS